MRNNDLIMLKSHKPNRALSSELRVLLSYYHWSFLTHRYEHLEFVLLRWFVREFFSERILKLVTNYALYCFHRIHRKVNHEVLSVSHDPLNSSVNSWDPFKGFSFLCSCSWNVKWIYYCSLFSSSIIISLPISPTKKPSGTASVSILLEPSSE